MKTETRDITADLCGLDGNKAIPMYSYVRPAYLLWQAVYEGLVDAGRTHEQAVDWLQSKSARWALDGELGDQLEEIGRALGRAQARAAIARATGAA